MALNLGAMISAARSQRNPAGEALSNTLAGNEYKNKMIGEQTGIGGQDGQAGVPVSFLTQILSKLGTTGV